MDVAGLLAGIPALLTLIANTCRRLKDLRVNLRSLNGLYNSLSVKQYVLQDIWFEYSKSISIVAPSSNTLQTLAVCVDDCANTCRKIDEQVEAIEQSRRYTRKLTLWWEENTLKGLLVDLDRSWSTMQTQLTTIR